MFGFDKLYQFILFGVLLLVMILLFVFFARPLFIALFVSILLTVLLKPLVKKLNRRFSHTTSVLLSLVGFLGCGILIFILITGSILPALKNFVMDLPDILQGTAGLSTELANKYPWLGSPDVMQEQIRQIVETAADWSVAFAKDSFVPVLKMTSSIAEMIGIPILTFYFMKDSHHWDRHLIRIFPRAEAEIMDFFEKTGYMLGKYMQGQLTVSLISGTFVCVIGMLLGMRHSVLFAFLSAIGEWIPVVGPIVAAVLAITTVMIQDTAMAWKLMLFYVVMFKLNHNIIYPALVGRATKLHPVVIMVGVLFAGHVGGAFGMLIVVPSLAILYIYFTLVYDIQQIRLKIKA